MNSPKYWQTFFRMKHRPRLPLFPKEIPNRHTLLMFDDLSSNRIVSSVDISYKISFFFLFIVLVNRGFTVTHRVVKQIFLKAMLDGSYQRVLGEFWVSVLVWMLLQQVQISPQAQYALIAMSSSLVLQKHVSSVLLFRLLV